jgi:hypothetical protein
MVSKPLRAVPALLDTEYVTVPLPVPEEGLVSVTHAGVFVTVHEQSAAVVTVTVPLPPERPNVALAAGETVVVAHPPAACEIECVAPAITGTALRAAPVFGAIE